MSEGRKGRSTTIDVLEESQKTSLQEEEGEWETFFVEEEDTKYKFSERNSVYRPLERSAISTAPSNGSVTWKKICISPTCNYSQR
ncbi:hypothetical protein CEXT_140361 [Caerostris extrusa]|uniref:Uncharacterized protein n=1 Tax=Caerostris extrusa TaxID=172846 RepID=A0AAV4XQL1_CAEEX|nr:hypothetical protein CEXT_140361 [Caerostris extrusa]